MNSLILATEVVVEHVGDDLQMVAYILAGIVLLVAAVTTAVVSPGREHHDH